MEREVVLIIGIDLGTTNSAVGIWRDGHAQLIPNSLGHVLTPSAVSLGDDDELIVGLAARERQVTHPELTATAFKRYMGSKRLIKLGPQSLYPEELSALVLRSLRADAEKFLGETVTDAVITVPAYFNDRQRKATRRAGQIAGLRVERLLNEPTAAALAYGIHHRDADQRLLVFDLGGGTFDVSVLELFGGVIEVRASTGDNHLGGEDFNEVLVDKVFSGLKENFGVRHKSDEALLYQRVREQAEKCRRELSSASETTMSIVWRDVAHEIRVTADAFEKASEALIERLRTPVLRALRDSRIPVDQLPDIALVGGATRMPIVRRAVSRMFGSVPIEMNPDEAVALGAAVQAGLKARDSDLRDVVLTDVCPYTLGVAVSERQHDGSLLTDKFAPIIERNTVIPASRERAFGPTHENQERIDFRIYQGESAHCEDNILIGKLSVPLPAAARARETSVNCRFTYDINGLLEVDVTFPGSDERHQLLVIDDEAQMNPAELEWRRQALAALKVHPREHEATRAVIERARRCYEAALGDRREWIGRSLRDFEYVVEGQDPRAIDAAREELVKRLDAVEGNTRL